MAFLGISGQWRAVPAGTGGARYIGLDYAAAAAGLAFAGVEMRPDLWEQVRLIEAGAVRALNGER